MLIESRPVLDPELTALVVTQQHELRGPGSVLADAAHLVAVVDGRVVAAAAWRVADDETAEILRVYVRPAYRRRGIGGQLMLAVEEEILAAGRAFVAVPVFGPAAAGFFDSCGYPGGAEKRISSSVRSPAWPG